MQRNHSLWDSFLRNAAIRGDESAFCFEDSRLTHSELIARGRTYAGELSHCGVEPGDRIAIICDAREEFFLVLSAAACLGAILVPLNWRLSRAEIGAILDDCAPKLLFADTSYGHLLDGRAERLIVLPADRQSREEFAARFDAGPVDRDGSGNADAPVVILYTAAHDGEQRGAVISQANLVASSVQMNLALGFDENDVFLGNLPFFHMMALALALGVNFAGGSTVVRPRFDAAEAAELVDTERVTLIGTFPPMLSSLLDEREHKVRDFRSLRFCMGLDAAPTIERFEASCPDAAFWSIYGQTETTGNVTYGLWRDRPGTAGRVAALTTLAILDQADRPLDDGEIGEIAVRGPTVFQGYWGRDEENAFVTRNGWHHTGDQGRLNDGWLSYHARAPHKQLIKTGGENVYPAEVETVLASHPAIRSAVVFGIPDERWGESIVAICEADSPVEDHAVKEFVAQRLARYKRPRILMVADGFPTHANGSVDREEVKLRFLRSQQVQMPADTFQDLQRKG
ncbi:MAG: AMP-binding protein [Rhizobiaceae bacterium]